MPREKQYREKEKKIYTNRDTVTDREMFRTCAISNHIPFASKTLIIAVRVPVITISV